MGLFSAIRDVFRDTNNIKAINKKDYESSASKIPLAETLSQSDINKLLRDARDISTTKEARYLEYEEMVSNGLVQSILNMYVADATKSEEDSSKILQVVCSDDNIKKDIEAILESYHIDDRLVEVAYNLCKYGNHYWKLNYNKKGNDLILIENVRDLARISDLYLRGNPEHFAVIEDNNEYDKDMSTVMSSNLSSIKLFSHNSFVHFYLPSTELADQIYIDPTNGMAYNRRVDAVKSVMGHKDDSTKGNDLNKNDNELEYGYETIDDDGVVVYDVVEGLSILERARQQFRIRQLLEDSMLAARISRSEYYRLLGIEVGDSSVTDANRMKTDLKSQFDTTVSLDTNKGKFSATRSNKSWAKPIVYTTYNGKGAIDYKAIGDDFQVRNIADIDYFDEQFFLCLGVSKAQLTGENLGGLGGGDKLTQLNILYSDKVALISRAIVIGVKETINNILDVTGRSGYKDKYTLKYTSPYNMSRLQQLQSVKTSAQIVGDIADAISRNSENVDKDKLLKSLCTKYLPEVDLEGVFLEPEINPTEDRENGFGGPPSLGDDFDFDSSPGLDLDSGEGDIEADSEELSNPEEDREDITRSEERSRSSRERREVSTSPNREKSSSSNNDRIGPDLSRAGL